MPLKIGCNADALGFGVGLGGAGKVWVDDVTLEVEDETPSSGQARQPLAGTQNLDFEH
jgi:hypothetical protein